MTRPEWLTVPNAITIARLGLAPVFLGHLVEGRTRSALVVFAIAMGSDFLDGLMARLLDQRSKLGGLLDPIADKLLVLTALWAVAFFERVPWWLVGLIAVRDGAMAIGAWVVHRKALELPTAPARLGKYATFALAVLVILALASLEVRSPLLDAYVVVMGFVSALCVVTSTAQYIARFGYLFFAPPRSRPSLDERSQRPTSP